PDMACRARELYFSVVRLIHRYKDALTVDLLQQISTCVHLAELLEEPAPPPLRSDPPLLPAELVPVQPKDAAAVVAQAAATPARKNKRKPTAPIRRLVPSEEEAAAREDEREQEQDRVEEGRGAGQAGTVDGGGGLLKSDAAGMRAARWGGGWEVGPG